MAAIARVWSATGGRRALPHAAVASRWCASAKRAAEEPPTGKLEGEEPLAANQVWLRGRLNEVSSTTGKELHDLRVEVEKLSREYNSRQAKYSDSVIEAKRLAGVTSWRIYVVAASTIATVWHAVREAASQAKHFF